MEKKTMREKVIQFIEEQALITPNTTVLVGVSGGPDSVALLHLLVSLKETYQLKVIAVSIDHMLREEASQEDVAYVQSICAAWGVPFEAEEVNVNKYKALHKVGTQVAARELRYEAFARQMERHGADYLALGHHGDDQIETMIMSLARTTNLSAFTGIPVKRSFSRGKITRPLLAVSKEEINSYCVMHGLDPRIDASNFEPTYTRNDIRLNVVPKLKETNANLHETVQHLTETLREDERFLTEAAEMALESLVHFDEKAKTATFSIKKFQACSVSLQRRIYRLILNYLYEELPSQLSYIHEEIFLTLFHLEAPNKSVDFPRGLIVERAYDQALLCFQDTMKKAKGIEERIDSVPSVISLPNGATLSVSYTDKKVAEAEHTYIFSKEQVSFPLHIRNRKAGDRMSWYGLQGRKKLKSIFIDEKVPRKIRDEMFVVTDDSGEIMWVIQLKKATLNRDFEQPPFILLEYKE